VSGTIVDNVNWGADNFDSVTQFSVGGTNFAAGTTVYWGQNGTFNGTTATAAAASLVVNSDGTYTYTLLDNLLLGNGTQGEQTDTLATVSITGKDQDGDTQPVSVQLMSRTTFRLRCPTHAASWKAHCKVLMFNSS
jgi:hypothetical protein